MDFAVERAYVTYAPPSEKAAPPSLTRRALKDCTVRSIALGGARLVYGGAARHSEAWPGRVDRAGHVFGCGCVTFSHCFLDRRVGPLVAPGEINRSFGFSAAVGGGEGGGVGDASARIDDCRAATDRPNARRGQPRQWCAADSISRPPDLRPRLLRFPSRRAHVLDGVVARHHCRAPARRARCPPDGTAPKPRSTLSRSAGAIREVAFLGEAKIVCSFDVVVHCRRSPDHDHGGPVAAARRGFKRRRACVRLRVRLIISPMGSPPSWRVIMPHASPSHQGRATVPHRQTRRVAVDRVALRGREPTRPHRHDTPT